MSANNQGSGPDKLSQVVADARRHMKDREKTYREKAMKMYPHVCGRCAREFSGKQLKELTVHHRDHNHDNNPPDGSNWELLCLYCHDHEHTRGVQEDRSKDNSADRQGLPSLAHSPFAALSERLKSPEK